MEGSGCTRTHPPLPMLPIGCQEWPHFGGGGGDTLFFLVGNTGPPYIGTCLNQEGPAHYTSNTHFSLELEARRGVLLVQVPVEASCKVLEKNITGMVGCRHSPQTRVMEAKQHCGGASHAGSNRSWHP